MNSPFVLVFGGPITACASRRVGICSESASHAKALQTCLLISLRLTRKKATQKLATFLGLVLINAHRCTDLAWSPSCRGINHLDEKSY
jgi:hypothetical protein